MKNVWCESCVRCADVVGGLRCGFYCVFVNNKPSRYCDSNVHEWRKDYKDKRKALKWFTEWKKSN